MNGRDHVLVCTNFAKFPCKYPADLSGKCTIYTILHFLRIDPLLLAAIVGLDFEAMLPHRGYAYTAGKWKAEDKRDGKAKGLPTCKEAHQKLRRLVQIYVCVLCV